MLGLKRDDLLSCKDLPLESLFWQFFSSDFTLRHKGQKQSRKHTGGQVFRERYDPTFC